MLLTVIVSVVAFASVMLYILYESSNHKTTGSGDKR